MATPNPSPLLNLPGELRNRIYRLTLPETVTVNSATFPEPPLLTCKKIRQEASAIFYSESNFNIDLTDWDSTAYMAVVSKLPTFKVHNAVPIPAMFRTYGTPNWQNFNEFLRRKHAADPYPFRRAPKVSPLKRVQDEQLQALIVMVNDLRGVPWTVVQPAVQRFPRTLIACDQRWADD